MSRRSQDQAILMMGDPDRADRRNGKLKITLMDRSLYFKGLLLLTRQDRQITSAEFQLMQKVGRCLDFEPGFCESTIKEILENDFIVDSPPVFSSPEIAARFIKDGLTLGSCDHAILEAELGWLQAIALANGIELEPLVEAWNSRLADTAEQRLEAENFIFYDR